MATLIRPELSPRNEHWINKHRHYELKHFCLQYPMWKKLYSDFDNPDIPLSTIDRMPTDNIPGNPTEKRALMKAYYSEKMRLIERAAKDADIYLYEYILRGVTEGLSYTHLKSKLDIPCSKDMYYDRYRRFFRVLHDLRD